ncbi:MAG TPA: hypothetical protein QGH10_06865, partial [Armatimonadota bacterium]|nr:hypothetical protein [Armatimonadota bacterium]
MKGPSMTPLSTALLIAICPAQAAPDLYCGAENIIAAEGAIHLARRWESAFVEDFDEGLDRWEITNYEDKLAFESTDGDDGGQAALVTNHGAEGDTAFELTSELIPVIGGEHFRLALRWRSNRAMNRLTGHKGLYMTQIQWVDDASEEVGTAPFVFGEAGDEWQTLRLEGTVPAETAGLVIRIGCDHPNIEDGEFLALDDIQLELQSAAGGYEESGSMRSRPIHAPDGDGRVGWQADVPPGTSLLLQVASAPEAGGGPGEWSEFTGPDGSAETYFEQPGALPAMHSGRSWLRYAASIRTDDRAQTPVLEQVTVGGGSDGPWTGLDTHPPVVAERSPTRTADASQPISFQVHDETGIDPLTLQVWLDGSDVTDALALRDGTYTYAPPAPLAPVPGGLGMAR